MEVERDVNGDRYSANLDDVYQATNKYWWPPKDAAAWDKWFLSHGTPPKKYGSSDGINAIDRPSFGAGSFNAASNNDISVAQSATLAPALIVMLARTVIWGMIEKYVGGQILGIVINAGGSVTVKVLKNQKETLVNLSDELSKNVRNFVKTAANKGDDQAIVAVKKLQGVAACRVSALTNEAKEGLRVSARDIWHARTGRRAVWDGMDVHHRIPLEWSHLFPKADANRAANLIGMKSADHTLVTNAWNAWRQGLNGRIPTQSEIIQQALRIDEQFGKLMKFLP